MHVRNMILCLGTVFLFAAAFVWATYDPDLASGERSELMEAYNRYNTLYQQGRYSEAEPYAKEALRLGAQPAKPRTSELSLSRASAWSASVRASSGSAT